VSDVSSRGQGNQTSARVIEQSTREEGIVRAGETPIPHERPEDWGWHGETGKVSRIAAVAMIALLLVMMFGNHEGRIEDLYLVGAALIILIALIRDHFRRKNAWRSR
jgi:hypothetical protein